MTEMSGGTQTGHRELALLGTPRRGRSPQEILPWRAYDGVGKGNLPHHEEKDFRQP